MKPGDWVKLGEWTGVLIRRVVPEDEAHREHSKGVPAWWALFIGDQKLMWSYEDQLSLIKKEIR